MALNIHENGLQFSKPYQFVKSEKYEHRRSGTFGLEGAVTLLPEKKLHSARKSVLYKRTQIAVKTKTFTILTSNETIIQGFQ